MRISNKVGGKEGRVDKGQNVRICELCSNSVTQTEQAVPADAGGSLFTAAKESSTFALKCSS